MIPTRADPTRPDPLSFALYILLLVTAVHSQSSTAVVVITLECPFLLYMFIMPLFSRRISALYLFTPVKTFHSGLFSIYLNMGAYIHTYEPVAMRFTFLQKQPSLLPIQGEFCSLDRSPCHVLHCIHSSHL